MKDKEKIQLMAQSIPILIPRKKFVDDRGTFENIALAYKDFPFKGKRTYICTNFVAGTIRGYHYHVYEKKIFICLKGAVKFSVLKGNMPKTVLPEEQKSFVLSEDMPMALYIPNKYANAWMSLTSETILLGISNKTVDESRADDFRRSPEFYIRMYDKNAPLSDIQNILAKMWEIEKR